MAGENRCEGQPFDVVARLASATMSRRPALKLLAASGVGALVSVMGAREWLPDLQAGTKPSLATRSTSRRILAARTGGMGYSEAPECVEVNSAYFAITEF